MEQEYVNFFGNIGKKISENLKSSYEKYKQQGGILNYQEWQRTRSEADKKEPPPPADSSKDEIDLYKIRFEAALKESITKAEQIKRGTPAPSPATATATMPSNPNIQIGALSLDLDKKNKTKKILIWSGVGVAAIVFTIILFKTLRKKPQV
jgi:hypothetical protein